ncbi:protoporphyrinogen oxidase [Streptomyces sp. VRA16 Mangrove soil]|uniref:protoporphyrinogen oxidase n=1 Tax=Streptomyces sp. VRA16 Mangrove soil TaxID=2817434 RepID=UPI001A9F83C2|nr:protoporphyrinogen oxidase [Streptomyces sp. VRA16 Mangrove soil]MBO1335563.1 protoporphyrinogen oxidase [Streptomyces sp. VRA16 Mangrove soil]
MREADTRTETETVRDVLVIGGGIAGLAAAHRLLDRSPGVRVTVLESSDRLGGKLRAGEIAGARIDLGAESMLARRPEAVGLAREVGLGDRLQPPSTATASIWTRDALRPMPKGHVMGVPGSADALAGVLSDEGLARIERDAELPPTPIGDDVAVGEYVAARLGREVVDRLVEPLLGGVYAGDAYRISLRSAVPQLFEEARRHTSLTEAVRAIQARAPQPAADPTPVFMGVEGGIGTLPGAVADAVRERGGEIVLGERAVQLGARGSADQRLRRGARPVTDDENPTTPREPLWRVVTESGRTFEATQVIIALPAQPAASLLRTASPNAAQELRGIEYASMALITLAYDKARADLPPGSGFLVPPVDGRTIKAATFASHKWGWIAEQNPDLTLVRTSVGRYGDDKDLARDDAELIDIARRDLREATGLTATPLDAHVTRWQDGLPQYPVGHAERVARIRGYIGQLPGVAVCGAAYDGVGIPACIASAYAAADELDGDTAAREYLKANPVQSLHGGAGE